MSGARRRTEYHLPGRAQCCRRHGRPTERRGRQIEGGFATPMKRGYCGVGRKGGQCTATTRGNEGRDLWVRTLQAVHVRWAFRLAANMSILFLTDVSCSHNMRRGEAAPLGEARVLAPLNVDRKGAERNEGKHLMAPRGGTRTRIIICRR